MFSSQGNDISKWWLAKTFIFWNLKLNLRVMHRRNKLATVLYFCCHPIDPQAPSHLQKFKYLSMCDFTLFDCMEMVVTWKRLIGSQWSWIAIFSIPMVSWSSKRFSAFVIFWNEMIMFLCRRCHCGSHYMFWYHLFTGKASDSISKAYAHYMLHS